MSSPYRQLMREIRKKKKEKKGRPDIQKWREYYRKAGPVEFATKELACPIDVPEHPIYGRPKYVILSPQQEEFLNDLFNGQKLSIAAASRGAGKTFALAIYVCWKICCFDYFECTVMGGSSQQSEIIQNYIDYWRLKKCLECGKPFKPHNRKHKFCSETCSYEYRKKHLKLTKYKPKCDFSKGVVYVMVYDPQLKDYKWIKEIR